jgi:glycine cleavage system H lipoate-binding protein/NAD-dependent dihydropyrimidine dehydrogenase PreA subunit
MVEITENGLTRLHPSCAYSVKENMIVKTKTERLKRGRKIVMELLLARCPNIDSVKNLAASLGVTRHRFTEMDNDCVLCGQCVRVCRDVVKAQAIDFTGRGRERYPRAPFDLPSEECIGCGSCTYVCPTGAMKMEYENVMRWRRLPAPLRKCRYMRMGFISHKICPNNYECWNCEVDQSMEDLAKTHPVFMLKKVREEEREKIETFEILYDRMYDEGHLWFKRVGGHFRLGIDDFTRKLMARIDDIKLPALKANIRAGEPIWIISGHGKTLHMYSPIDCSITDLNPDILDNPALISMDPYGRGWILTVAPGDVLQTSKILLSGRSAKEWLVGDVKRFHDLADKGTDMAFAPDHPFPDQFAARVDKDLWRRIDRRFFMRKEKKKARLYGVEDISSALKKEAERH